MFFVQFGRRGITLKPIRSWDSVSLTILPLQPGTHKRHIMSSALPLSIGTSTMETVRNKFSMKTGRCFLQVFTNFRFIPEREIVPNREADREKDIRSTFLCVPEPESRNILRHSRRISFRQLMVSDRNLF